MAVLNGPGVNVDRSLLAEWLERWASELHVTAKLVECPDRSSITSWLEQEVSSCLGVLVNPGSLRADPLLVQAAQAQPAPLVWIDLLDANDPGHPVIEAGVMRIRGRGIGGYRWALRRLVQHATWPPIIVPYGLGPDRLADLRIPKGPGPHPVAVLIHGGSWQEAWERDTIEPLAIDLAARGYATWNIEYRRVGASEGGWPATCTDIATALSALSSLTNDYDLNLEQLVIIGHSAGGHLALWSATKRGTASMRSAVQPRLIVSLAGIPDLLECARRGMGDGGNIAAEFVGASYVQAAQAYVPASPAESLPLGVRQLLVQGTEDALADLVDLNRLYARAATSAGDPVELIEVDGATHFDVIDPASSAWAATVERLMQLVPVVSAEDLPVSRRSPSTRSPYKIRRSSPS